jgi:hypothetical protein
MWTQPNTEPEITVLCAELPTSIFDDLSTDGIETAIIRGLPALLAYSERITVVRRGGQVVFQSPKSLVPKVSTAMLTIWWPSEVIADTTRFWKLVRSGDAVMAAIDVQLSFPNGGTLVVKRS